METSPLTALAPAAEEADERTPAPEADVEETTMKRLLTSEESPKDLVMKLKKHAKELRDQKKKCMKDLRNAVKRNKRLRERAKNLGDTDLLDILRMRSSKILDSPSPQVPTEEAAAPVEPGLVNGSRTPSPPRFSEGGGRSSMETPPKHPRASTCAESGDEEK